MRTIGASLLVVTIIITMGLLASPTLAAGQHKKVLLTSVSALTFHDGQYTKGRRSSPIPQANCQGGPCYDRPTTIQCRNVGDAGGGDVQWKCEAQMKDGIQFGSVSVSCEGYDNPDDVYVLKGSCGLEYTLRGAARSDGGHRRGGNAYRHEDDYRRRQQQAYQHSYDDADLGSTETAGWGEWIFFGLVLAAFYFIFCSGRGRAPAGSGGPSGMRGGGGGSSYGGGGGGSGPYSGGSGGGGTYTRGGGSYTQTMHEEPRPQPPRQQGMGNFWTGLLGGALLGNMMGGGNRMGYGRNTWRPHGGYDIGAGGFGGGGGGGFGGGGGGGGTTTATGYGGTTRR